MSNSKFEATLPRPRPPYLQKETDRHGKQRWYVRIRPNPRVRLPGAYGSPEFVAAYHAAISAAQLPMPTKTASGSIKWLIERYRESMDYRALSPLTRRDRDYIFGHIIQLAGERPYKALSRKIVIAGRDSRAAHPSAANKFLDALKALFKWAIDADLCDTNPAEGVRKLKSAKAGGHAPWTEADIARYQAHWPLGSKERVWLDVLVYTGLRRGDAVRLGRQHIKGGIATLRTEKSKFRMEVNLPILPVLQKTLEAGQTGDLAFICGAKGNPLTKRSFGLMFVAAARKAGIEGKTAHGLRKAAATQAAEAGATVAQLKALFGWSSDAMPALYTRTADRRKLAIEAMEKLERRNGS